ncbi:hypothetical protein ILUMI_04302 [Ignelater luminosus]|uniref:PiggyBac transposable element-derived protein domain-containing protein n=1 Tax=Ignelater luminosus TaxID=2038154 RepID=A0A8K0D9Y5_IGNLU|nr:hypothetical protein ILUMI_04302 [Ignelater luminosus]
MLRLRRSGLNIEDDNHYRCDIYITPPTDAGNDTDEDSGEKDCQDPDRLNRNQLDAEAELYINDKPVTEESNVEDNTPTTSSIPSNPPKKVRNAASVIQVKQKNLHAADNSVLDPTDRMVKVRPLIVALNRLFVDYAPIEQSISIDESMITYFDRHGCKQFIRGKPIRWKYNSIVTLLSNQYGVKPLQSAVRFSAKEKKKVYIPQPNVVYMYNKYKGGVDQFDNNIATYMISMREKNGTCQSLYGCATQQ